MKACIWFVVLLSAATLSAQTNKSEEEAVLKTERAWLEASQKKDVSALQAIVADDFVGSGPNGVTVDKEMVTTIPEGATMFDQTKLSDLSAKVFGNTAVVFGKLVTTNPADPPETRIAMFYVKRAGQWKMVAAQLVPLTPEKDTAAR